MYCSVINSRQRHDAALLDPEIHEMLIDLQVNFDDYAPWERGESLINLVLCGCSVRALAEVLPCSASTIYRLMDLADPMPYLPEKLMRHADIRTTMNTYGDVVTNEMAEAQGQVASLAVNSTQTSRAPS